MPVRTNNSYDIPSSYFEQQIYLQRRAELEKRFSVGELLSDLGSAAETGLDTVTGGVQNLAQDTNTFFTETVPGKTGEALWGWSLEYLFEWLENCRRNTESWLPRLCRHYRWLY